MQLECAEGLASPNATESDIRKAFADDCERGEFAILSESDQVYIQASGQGDGPYLLEYREGDDNRHYQCTREATRSEVESAFIKYLKRDPSWKTDIPWSQLAKEPWWKFW